MERLRRVRKSNGMTVRDLAEASGVAPSTISKVENGQRKPQAATLEALASVLETTVDELKKPLPARMPEAPMSKEMAHELLMEELVERVWSMMEGYPEEALDKIRMQIDMELAGRWWARQTKLEAEAYGLTPREYDKQIQDLYQRFKGDGGGSNDEWSAYFSEHWPWSTNLEEAKRERTASG